MTNPRSYLFSAVPTGNLPPGDLRDPFRFPADRVDPHSVFSGAQPSIEVEDVDLNRQITNADHFFLRGNDGRRLAMNADTGLRLLNYYVDPNVLTRNHLEMTVRTSDTHPELFSNRNDGEIGLRDLSFLSPARREEIEERHFPFWEADGHLDMDILEGLRIYTADENRRFTGIQGVPIYFNWRYFRNRVLYEKGAVAGGFIVGEHFINPTFMWQMYATNFFSMIGGSLSANTRAEGLMEAAHTFAGSNDASPSLRRMANIQTAQNRARIAEDHLYWTVTWPVVVAACFADPNFRRFWPAPWRFPRPQVLYNYFDAQFRTTFSAMGRSPAAWLRNPLGLGTMLLSGFGIYEVSSLWFDVYGGLRQGSTENRIFSGASTVLVEAALLARASREMQALTGSGSLNWANLARLRTLQARVSLLAEIPQNSWAARAWENSPRAQAFFERRFLPTVRVAEPVAHSPVGRLFNRMGIPRWGLEAQVSPLRPAVPPLATPGVAAVEGTAAAEGATILEATSASRGVVASETILTRAAAVRAATILPAAEEAALLMDGLAASSRVRVVGLPLLAFAVGVGIGIGICYATGIFDRRYGPRDMARDVIGR